MADSSSPMTNTAISTPQNMLTTKHRDIPAFPLFQSTAYQLCEPSCLVSLLHYTAIGSEGRSTHHWPFELCSILPQLLHSVRLIPCSLNKLACLLCPHVFQYRPQLILCRWIFRYVELELCPLHLVLVAMVCGLVFRSRLDSMSRDLLE